MKVRMTSGGLAVSSDYEMATCKEPTKCLSGKARRRNDRKRFKTQSYIEKTLERGMIMNVAKSLD